MRSLKIALLQVVCKAWRIIKKNYEFKIQNYLFRNPNFKSFRTIINQYVKSLNEKPNKNSTAQARYKLIHGRNVNVRAKVPKSVFGAFWEVAEIKRYTSQKDKVISILDELAAKKLLIKLLLMIMKIALL